MTRRLVVCIDGTWNSSAEKSYFFAHPTNVHRISELLLDDGKSQRVIYVPGVGTRGLADRVMGGVWGTGCIERVCSGYSFLCKGYEEGDQIALFGFSRGAFAARSIVGVIQNLGVLHSDQLHNVVKAVSLYRRALMGRSRYEKISAFKETRCHEEKPVIAFVGVWDTVIRYGPLLTPLGLLLEKTLQQHLGLFDHRIPLNVRHFCHALALDEHRSAFWPWRAEKQNTAPPDQVEEMWFSGSHSDIGGGYVDSRLAEFPLRWMCERAAAAGLKFNHMPSVGASSHLAPLNPSRIGIWRTLPSRRRTVEDCDCLHDSAKRRIQSSSYRPKARLSAEMLSRLTCA